MTKKFIWIMAVLMLFAGLPSAFGMGELIVVTKQTQAKLGLNFTLVAKRVDDEAVLVHMEIPRKGKLKNLRSVSMSIYSDKNNLFGRPRVAATLQKTPGKNGSWIVSFQLAPDLADKCSIDIIGPYEGLSYEVYAVELKGYVTARK